MFFQPRGSKGAKRRSPTRTWQSHVTASPKVSPLLKRAPKASSSSLWLSSTTAPGFSGRSCRPSLSRSNDEKTGGASSSCAPLGNVAASTQNWPRRVCGVGTSPPCFAPTAIRVRAASACPASCACVRDTDPLPTPHPFFEGGSLGLLKSRRGQVSSHHPSALQAAFSSVLIASQPAAPAQASQRAWAGGVDGEGGVKFLIPPPACLARCHGASPTRDVSASCEPGRGTGLRRTPVEDAVVFGLRLTRMTTARCKGRDAPARALALSIPSISSRKVESPSDSSSRVCP